MLTVDAVWDDRLRRFKYRLPGVGFAVAERGRTSTISPDNAIAQEARLVANLMKVQLPAQFELVIHRGGF